MASQDDIFQLLQTIFEELKELRHEFKMQQAALTLAHNQIRELKGSQKNVEKVFKDSVGVMWDVSKSVDDIQGKVCSQMTSADSPRLHEVVESLDLKIKSYAEATKAAQISFCQEQEIEKSNQLARRKNVRISGLPEIENEDVKSVVTKFLDETLQVSNAELAQAFRIGNKGAQPRGIIVKFVNQTQRDVALANKAMLKGRRIWLDPDLTPLQVEVRRKELAKVKEAQESGFVAYLHDGRAIVTQRRRVSST